MAGAGGGGLCLYVCAGMQISSFVGYEVYVRWESGVFKLQGRIFSFVCQVLRENLRRLLYASIKLIPYCSLNQIHSTCTEDARHTCQTHESV